MCRKMILSSSEVAAQFRELLDTQEKMPGKLFRVTYREAIPISLVRDFLERLDSAYKRELTEVAQNGFEDGYLRALRDNEIEFVSAGLIVQEMKYQPRLDKEAHV